jgi:hypothetical protein
MKNSPDKSPEDLMAEEIVRKQATRKLADMAKSGSEEEGDYVDSLVCIAEGEVMTEDDMKILREKLKNYKF